jgi:hypothetical protein
VWLVAIAGAPEVVIWCLLIRAKVALTQTSNGEPGNRHLTDTSFKFPAPSPRHRSPEPR